ncbi:hypothetical protein QAD02_001401 [Eretmocerus hayati]|uniref:Uncharacterized protein n=1 Tax=Eretmocerus hayati TaxID=131215 RepID=A0ACC2NG54_9HYME|nr:hypothetical protein QAD02_001401 [Eretmocerus hayati]
MAPSNDSKEKWVRRFVISETNRHKKGFTIYKVTSLIFLKSSPDVISRVSIWKRYSDFKKLYTSMQALHITSRVQEPFPPFPKPKFFGRFEAEVIEERRKSALKLLEFIGRHTELFSSNVFVKFFENDDLNDKVLDCSQSYGSDTSEDDKNAHSVKSKDHAQDETDHSNFACTQKTIATITNGQNKVLRSEHKAIKFAAKTQSFGQENDVHSNINSSVEDIVNPQSTCTTKNCVTIHDGSDLMQFSGESVQYILIAAAHMSAAFRHEAIAEYEEAFTQYKLGISHLMNGVQSEESQEKRIIIQEKISKYLHRAERLYNRHLNCNVSALHKSVLELQNYKVIRLMECNIIVKDVLQGFERVIKTVEREAGCTKDISNYILRGKVPYMVQLYAAIQTESTVFLVLQFMSRGRLWDFAKSTYRVNSGKKVTEKRRHSRSISCDAIIQMDLCGDPSRSCLKVQMNVSEKLLEPPNEKCISLPSKHSSTETTEILKNAQKLLQSVNDTLRRSNSITTRLQDSNHLDHKQKTNQMNHMDCVVQGDISDIDNDKKATNELWETRLMDVSKGCNVDKIMISSENTFDIKHNESQDQYDGQNLVNPRYDDSSIKTESQIINENQPQLIKFEENDLGEKEKPAWVIPESIVKIWAAQILLALEALHHQNVIITDLRPDNLLVDDSGNVSMTYIVPRKNINLLHWKRPYAAPELCMYSPSTSHSTSADVFSFGVILYELLTGYDFESRHVGQFHSHSLVNIPDHVSPMAKSLLLKVLMHQPRVRLTIPEIKQHPFFINTDWLRLLNAQV